MQPVPLHHFPPNSTHYPCCSHSWLVKHWAKGIHTEVHPMILSVYGFFSSSFSALPVTWTCGWLLPAVNHSGMAMCEATRELIQQAVNHSGMAMCEATRELIQQAVNHGGMAMCEPTRELIQQAVNHGGLAMCKISSEWTITIKAYIVLLNISLCHCMNRD